MATLSPLVLRPASEQGALPYYESKCSCGMVISSSMQTSAQLDAAAHLAYHARKGA